MLFRLYRTFKVKRNLNLLRLTCILIFAINVEPLYLKAQQKTEDSSKLGKAIDYFAGGKFHEALMLLADIDKKYELNPRFKGYLGVCYYHEWDYGKACQYLDKALPQLEIYAPHERSVYYGAAAESHFMLSQYDVAIPLYEKQLLVCFANERGDVLYRLGLCYMFKEKWQNAADYLESAIDYYKRFTGSTTNARIIQAEKMRWGCVVKLEDLQNKNE